MAISKKIKGITIQFNGDTTNLGKALGSAESAVISTESELRKVNKALKDIDPSNTVLLAQKQDILNEAIEASKKKLKGLEDAQEQVEKQFKSGDIGADAYREFQRTIEATKKKLNGLETESDNLKKAQREMANNGADFAKEKIEGVGKAAKTEGKKINDLGDDFKNAEKDARSFGGGIDAAQVALGNLAADGIKGLGSALKDYAADSQTASNSFAAQTGATAEKMQKYSGVIDELYKNSFGESKNDVANAMALVKQTVGETDAGKLKEMTESAMTLSDTFGFDVSEQLRAVNMLTKQFGISGDEAYNLIVQGAQKGLNKNGDLLDTINEYAVHYKQLGYTSDEFFNSLANGTASGTFSVDKLGDAMKEFGIRSKDTATTTTEGFTLIGLDADKMREKFAAGGESAKLATQETLKALFELDDQVVQNQAGVDLFGTMWEDLGKEGVEALINTNGEIDKTEEALQKVKDVKYDDITTEITGLGREFQEEILKPVIEDFMPDIKNAMQWLKDNLPALKPLIKGIGTAAVTAFAVDKVSSFASGVGSIINTAKGAFGAIKGLSSATGILGTAISTLSSPFGLILGGAGLVAALGAAVLWLGKAEVKTYELSESQKELYKRIDETKEKQQEMREENQKLIDNKESEYQYYRDLKTELDNIVTPTGQIKQGYEDRAKFILTELENVTEKEIEYNGNVIKNYQDLSKEIDKTLKLKEAEATLGVYEDDYKEAIKGKTSNKQIMDDAYKNYFAILNDLGNERAKLERLQREHEANPTDVSIDVEIGLAEKNIKIMQEELGRANEKYKDARTTYYNDMNTIKNYSNLSSAIISGDTDKVKIASEKMVNNFQNAEYATNDVLSQQVLNLQQNYADMVKAVENGEPGVTQEMVDAARTMHSSAVREYNTGFENSKGKIEGSVTSALKRAMKDAGINVRPDCVIVGGDLMDGVAEGVGKFDITTPVATVAQWTVDTVKDIWQINSPSKVGRSLGGYFVKGLELGFDDGEKNMLKTVNTVGTDTISTLKSQLDNLPTVSLNSRYTAAVKSGNITPALSGNRTFNISIGEFVNNTDRDIDTLAQQISVKLNSQMNQMQRGMGW